MHYVIFYVGVRGVEPWLLPACCVIGPTDVHAFLPSKKMMLAHSKADLHEQSLTYWRQLVCLEGVGQMEIDLPTCQGALKSAVVTNQWDEVGTIAEMLQVCVLYTSTCMCVG